MGCLLMYFRCGHRDWNWITMILVFVVVVIFVPLVCCRELIAEGWWWRGTALVLGLSGTCVFWASYAFFARSLVSKKCDFRSSDELMKYLVAFLDSKTFTTDAKLYNDLRLFGEGIAHTFFEGSVEGFGGSRKAPLTTENLQTLTQKIKDLQPHDRQNVSLQSIDLFVAIVCYLVEMSYTGVPQLDGVPKTVSRKFIEESLQLGKTNKTKYRAIFVST